MNSLVDEVRQIEGRVVEISRLQEIFSEKVLQQVRFIQCQYYDLNYHNMQTDRQTDRDKQTIRQTETNKQTNVSKQRNTFIHVTKNNIKHTLILFILSAQFGFVYLCCSHTKLTDYMIHQLVQRRMSNLGMNKLERYVFLELQ